MPRTIASLNPALVKHRAERIAARRQALKITQAEAAARADVSFSTWSRWESGRYSPTAESWESIAEALETTVGRLFPSKVAAK